MTTPRMVKDLGEAGLLELLRPILERHTGGFPLGTGDDVAVTEPVKDRLVWTVDTMIEATHFRWWDDPAATPEALARKLVVSNVSDLASKGSRPLYALLSLGLPGTESADRVERFFRGLDEALREYGARLAGGDTVRAPQWTLTLALAGTLAPDCTIAGRHRAQPGQFVYTTGQPGESYAGLLALEGKVELPPPAREHLIARHLCPSANPLLGEALARACPDLAMIDLSDGLAIDAARVAASSNVRIVLDEARLPVSEQLAAAAKAAQRPASDLTLHGGEDYELLFCTATPPETVKDHVASFGIPVTQIGRVEAGTGLLLQRTGGTTEDIAPQGFQHFG